MSVSDSVPISLSNLVGRFEGLGDNCEFGIVQRHFGAEPLGLLRWAGVDDITLLLTALNARFEGFGETDTLEHRILPGWDKYVAIDRKYGLYFHTDFCPTNDPVTLRLMAEKEVARFRFLRAKLIADLIDGEKIFVYRQKEALSDEWLNELSGTLSKYGERTKLLYVQEIANGRSGEVDKINDRLYRGYIDHLSAEDPPRVNFAAWINLLASAFVQSLGHIVQLKVSQD